MKFICLGYYDPAKFSGMTEDERNAMYDECLKYDDYLRANGHFGAGEALEHETAVTLSRKAGKVAMTDGPYAETKEQIGGFFALEAQDMNHASQLMSQHPGLKYGSLFEIHPVADMSEIIQASKQRRRAAAR